MPSTLTYPGVYVEEIPSGVRTIVGVSTSDTAFVDFFRRGPVNEAVRITSFADFERVFGGLDTRSEASYGIQQYYLNGGSVAWVVRVVDTDTTPARSAQQLLQRGNAPAEDALTVEAANPGEWGNRLQVGISYPSGSTDLFNLVVREINTVGGRRQVVNSEVHRNLSMDLDSAQYYVESTINNESLLLRVTDVEEGDRPNETEPGTDVTNPNNINNVNSTAYISFTTTTGNDGGVPSANALIAGMRRLDRINPFIFKSLIRK